ncbi:hypothetical protein KM043_009730 [Ampulex compressa]|nr:hypothetical protein KM043_009730 [Ampulex compressa]
METMCTKRKIMIAILIKEMMDDEQDEESILTEYAKFRRQVSDVFTNRRSEGTCNSLIKSRLFDAEENFQKYFKFTRERFSFLLNLIEEDSTISLYNRMKEPITGVEITQRTMQLTPPEGVGSTASSQRVAR